VIRSKEDEKGVMIGNVRRICTERKKKLGRLERGLENNIKRHLTNRM